MDINQHERISNITHIKTQLKVKNKAFIADSCTKIFSSGYTLTPVYKSFIYFSRKHIWFKVKHSKPNQIQNVCFRGAIIERFISRCPAVKQTRKDLK